jgi:hypothetical protein
LLTANGQWLSKGIHALANDITAESYIIPTGIIEFRPANAPFLNLIRDVELVVPPSGYIIRGHFNPFSDNFYLSEMSAITSLF